MISLSTIGRHCLRAISAAFGLFFALYPWQTTPWLLLFHLRGRSPHQALISAIFFLYGLFALQAPEKPTYFHPKQIERTFKFGHPLYTYRGSVDGGLPVVYFSKKKINGGARWQVHGSLAKSPYGWRLDLDEEPRPIAGSFSAAQFRFDLRERAAKWLKERRGSVPGDIAAAFFLGRSPPKHLKNAFRTAGLSHLLCLSGFHFAAFSALLALIWRKKRAPRIRALTFIALLSLYAFIVGDSPSVIRAYGAALFYFAAPLFGRESNALSSLGIVALFEMTLNPWSLFQVGFQLSYGATAALLLFYRPIKKRLDFTSNPADLRPLDLHAYVFGMFFLRLVALQIAVSLVTIPLCLVHFHTYPVGAAIFNFFYPPLLLGALAALPLTSAPLSALITSLEFLPRFLTFEVYCPWPPFFAAFALTAALTLKDLPGKMSDYFTWRS